MSDTNIAPAGTGYTWSKDTSATSNDNRVVAPGINDNNLTQDVDVQPGGDNVNACEAAGVVFSGPQTISSVGFINGTVPGPRYGFSCGSGISAQTTCFVLGREKAQMSFE